MAFECRFVQLCSNHVDNSFHHFKEDCISSYFHTYFVDEKKGYKHHKDKNNVMASRTVLQVFETYQKARVTFVQTIAELANRPQNIEALRNAGVMSLLRPLLLDSVPSIQQSAALALGRLANYSEELAEAVVSGEILPQLVYSLSEQNVWTGAFTSIANTFSIERYFLQVKWR
jgi:hypothetical protein